MPRIIRMQAKARLILTMDEGDHVLGKILHV